MGYSSYEVTGYIVNVCIILCPNCFNKLNFKDNESDIIFIETETDNACFCESCNNEILTTVLESL